MKYPYLKRYGHAVFCIRISSSIQDTGPKSGTPPPRENFPGGSKVAKMAFFEVFGPLRTNLRRGQKIFRLETCVPTNPTVMPNGIEKIQGVKKLWGFKVQNFPQIRLFGWAPRIADISVDRRPIDVRFVSYDVEFNSPEDCR